MTDITETADANKELPSTFLAHSTEKVMVTDKRGRVIAVRRMNALQLYRLSKAMGASASNSSLMDLAVIASSVSRIDTFDFAFPSKERDVEFIIEKLDFDGLTAAGEGLKQLNGADETGNDASKN